MGEIAEIAPELPEDGLVQVIAGAERLLDLRRQVPLAIERPTGRRAHEDESEEQDEEEERHEPQEPAERVPDHRAAISGPVRRTYLSWRRFKRFGSQPAKRDPS